MRCHVADLNAAVSSDDFGTNIVAILGVDVRLDVSDSALRELQIYYTGVESAEALHLRNSEATGVGMNLGDLVADKPACEIEVMRARIMEKSAVDFGLSGGGGRPCDRGRSI